MSSRNISQNLSNDSNNTSIPHLMQIQNNQESNPNSIIFQVTNSNSHINDSLHDDGSNENSMTECFINYLYLFFISYDITQKKWKEMKMKKLIILILRL